MSKHTYLVTGATGNIGGRVVTQLLDRGDRPRILARDVDQAKARFGDRVDIVRGNLDDADSLARAFAGVAAVFVVNSGSDIARRDRLAAEVARAIGGTGDGSPRLVKLSALGARADSSTATLGGWHADGEAAIRASGVAWTFVQAAGFMSNALAWAGAIKSDGVVRASTGNGQLAMIDPEDIAAVAVAALVSREHEGATLPITGPALLDYREMTRLIGEAIGRQLRFEAISDDAARARLLANHVPAATAEALVELWRAVRKGRVAIVTDTVARVLGRPARSFASWAEENKAAFA